jgi:hypothetical protein
MSTCFKGELPVFVNPCGWPAGITNLSPAPTPRGFHAIVERGLTFQNDDHLVVEVLVQRGAFAPGGVHEEKRNRDVVFVGDELVRDVVPWETLSSDDRDDHGSLACAS